MGTLYTNNGIIGILFKYFSEYFSSVTKPTCFLLTWLVIGMLALESVPSVRFLYRHFLCKVYPRSLNCYYRACAKANVSDTHFLRITTMLAKSIIPPILHNEPVFLCVDDTTIVKFGKKFADVSILHDHALHTGKPFVNGHCYVSLTLCVPVFNDTNEEQSIAYVPIPLGYHMWTKQKNKLVVAAEMITSVMPLLKDTQVVVAFDSWYAKKTFIRPLQNFDNIIMICNARHDTIMHDLPPAKTGKRGRPAKYGVRLLCADFEMTSRYKRFNVGHRRVLTNIFGDNIVHAYVTESSSGARRLFFCTANPNDIRMSFAWQEDADLRDVTADNVAFVPMKCYSMRWNIETTYYEQKTFWGLENYMLRSHNGIECMLNLINVSHSAMKILPYCSDALKGYRGRSSQDVRFVLGELIREQIFFVCLSEKAQTMKNSKAICAVLRRLSSFFNHAA